MFVLVFVCDELNCLSTGKFQGVWDVSVDVFMECNLDLLDYFVGSCAQSLFSVGNCS